MILLYTIRWTVWLCVVALLCANFPQDWDAVLLTVVPFTLLYQMMKALWRDSQDPQDP